MKESIVRAVAGTFVIISVLLTLFVHINWLAIAVFVGLNLLQSSITKFCPLEYFLEKMGIE